MGIYGLKNKKKYFGADTAARMCFWHIMEIGEKIKEYQKEGALKSMYKFSPNF